MNTTETHSMHTFESIVRPTAGTSITEGVGAVATIALAVIGLCGLWVNNLAAIATIVIGAVILMEGGTVTAAFRRLNYQGVSENQVRELGAGVTAEFFGGLAGIILGIVSLFQVMPYNFILLGVAVLVYGTALLLGGGTVSNLGSAFQTQSQTATSVVSMGAGGHMFIGLAAVVLGILAIIGLAPWTLILAGLLSLGASALFAGPVINTGSSYTTGTSYR